MFVAQGGADTLVVPAATEGFVITACQGGSRMPVRLYPKGTYGTIANTALPNVLGSSPVCRYAPREQLLTVR